MLMSNLFSEDIPAQARAVTYLLPSLRPPKPLGEGGWWGGVGGGGWLQHRTQLIVDRGVSRSRAIDIAIPADRPPTPNPSPPQAGGGE
jgi:hypothetical protein